MRHQERSFDPPAGLSAHAILTLQRSVGNAAVLQMLRHADGTSGAVEAAPHPLSSTASQVQRPEACGLHPQPAQQGAAGQPGQHTRGRGRAAADGPAPAGQDR